MNDFFFWNDDVENRESTENDNLSFSQLYKPQIRFSQNEQRRLIPEAITLMLKQLTKQ